MTKLNIATLGEESFRFGTAVMLRTLADSIKNPEINLFILDLNLKPKTRDAISQLVAEAFPGRPLRFLSPADSPLLKQILAAIGGEIPFYHYCCFSKFALLDLLSAEVEDVLFLDGDIYCNADLSELPSICAGHPLAAATDQTVVRAGGSTDFVLAGIDPLDPFFNSGLFFMDLVQWRDPALRAKAVVLSGKYKTAFTDQSVLNLIFHKRWKELPSELNLQSPYSFGIGRDIARGRRFNIHYLMNPKPWQAPADGASEFFFSALDRTPFRGWRPNRLYWFVHQQLRQLKYRLSRICNGKS